MNKVMKIIRAKTEKKDCLLALEAKSYSIQRRKSPNVYTTSVVSREATNGS